MKLCKRLVLLCLLAALMLPIPARAEGAIDPERPVYLTVEHVYENTPLTDVRFQLYLVAVTDRGGELTVTAPFEQFANLLDIRGENIHAWEAAALLLERYILAEAVTPADASVTDDGGAASFPAGAARLSQGLYLVTGTQTTVDGYVYTTSPFFVLLPGHGQTDSGWVYKVQAQTKPGRTGEKITVGVRKLWDDHCHVSQRPEAVTVVLYCNGVYYDEAVLTEAGGWEFHWLELDGSQHWQVVEEDVPGYRSEVWRSGNDFTIRNTCVKKISGESPDTGQDWVPFIVMVVSGTMLMLLGLIRLRKRKENKK